MNSLLAQFLSEARDFLQGIGEKLLQLEQAPDDAELMTELFRYVHTLKGNSGLFDFPEMTRVLHSGEDLMDAVRKGRVVYSQALADRLLDAMDFVGMLCDQIEAEGQIGATYAADSARLSESLRQLMADVAASPGGGASDPVPDPVAEVSAVVEHLPSASPVLPEGPTSALAVLIGAIPEAVRMQLYRHAQAGGELYLLHFSPPAECFFSGEDPLYQARGTPGIVWGQVRARAPWSSLAELDAYCCQLDFQLLSTAGRLELDEYYRYLTDFVRIDALAPLALVWPVGSLNGGPVYEDFVEDALACLQAGDLAQLKRRAETLLNLSNPDLWLSSVLRWLLLVLELNADRVDWLTCLVESLRTQQPVDWSLAGHPATVPMTMVQLEPERAPAATVSAGSSPTVQASSEEAAALAALIEAQRTILSLPIDESWQLGRIRACSHALAGCLRATGREDLQPLLVTATTVALDQGASAPLLGWLNQHFGSGGEPEASSAPTLATSAAVAEAASKPGLSVEAEPGGEPKFGRRAEDTTTSSSKSLKVDQVKIDRLMNLIGEIVVAKNALPYLAGRAESVYGVRDLSREIKGQYAVINRIAEAMQDAIMQVRMMPVSFIFQRFPRLVRDLSHKLNKEVNLQLEGEETEADKNIIESLGDPLVHIVRNSLDHGLETPAERRAAGKPTMGNLRLRANQESDRVVIEIQDDGRGIDPERVKQKAFEKGLIDAASRDRLSDQEAVNLVFLPGFSTADVVSDLSGRGVGMDVVRTVVERVGGSIALDSTLGQGTRLRLALPLSMAVSNVMIVESSGQLFGVPMDSVVETVRVPQQDIRTIKHSQTTVLRGRIVPLKSINSLLGLAMPQQANEEGELAVLVVRLGDESVGLLVDDFHETVDIILKPLSGILAGLNAYAGSALMGDGSVLMVLNVQELI